MTRASAHPVDAADLVREALDLGGILKVAAPSPRVRAGYRRAIWHAREQKLAPQGVRLVYSGRDQGDMTIRLVTVEPVAVIAAPAVAVPLRLGRSHVAIAETRQILERSRRDEFGRLNSRGVKGALDARVSKAQLSRSLRLLQALVLTFEERGHRVVPGSVHYPNLRVEIGCHDHGLRVVETLDRRPYEPTAAEVDRANQWSWVRLPKYAYAVSGKLELELDPHNGRRRCWADTTRWQLDDKLGEVVIELEQRAELDEIRRLNRLRIEDERRREEQRRLQMARLRMRDEVRTRELTAQIDAWRMAAAIREYCDALQRLNRDPATDDWIAWSRQHADAIDPTVGRPAPAGPTIPEFDEYAVRGWLRERAGQESGALS